MLPLRMSGRLRQRPQQQPRPARHVHFITMRVYYWRHFACYSFMLTLLGIHVVFQYAVAPNAGGYSSNWEPGESGGPLPDMAIACEQWIGRRSLKVPKSFMDQEMSDVAPRGQVGAAESQPKERSRAGDDRDRIEQYVTPSDVFVGATELSPQNMHNTYNHNDPIHHLEFHHSHPNLKQEQFKAKVDLQNLDKSINIVSDNRPVLGLSAPTAEAFVYKQVKGGEGLRQGPGGEDPLSGPLSPAGVPGEKVVMETINARQLQWTGQKSGPLVRHEAIPVKSIDAGHTASPYMLSSSLSPSPQNHHSNQMLDADGGGRASSDVASMSQGHQVVDGGVAGGGGSDTLGKGGGGPGVGDEGGGMPGSLGVASGYRTRDDSTNPHHMRYKFTCGNIHMINIKRKLGQGVTKQVYLGLYQGQKVAVKMVTRNVIDVLSCMKKLRRETPDPSTLPGEKHKCYTLPNMKLMKEILLLNQLNHPNLLRLQGYCVRSEETDSTSLQEHGIVAVYEYGLRFYVSNLREWPWQLRIKTAIELADLLDYLQHSPLGSLRISDFKDAHFLLKDGRIKLTDLDDVTSLEPTCQPNSGPEVDLKGQRTPANVCGFNLKCIAGICPGYNAIKNLDNFHRLFFSNLLTGHDGQTEEHMSRIRNRLDTLSMTAFELKQTLYHFLDIPLLPGYS